MLSMLSPQAHQIADTPNQLFFIFGILLALVTLVPVHELMYHSHPFPMSGSA